MARPTLKKLSHWGEKLNSSSKMAKAQFLIHHLGNGRFAKVMNLVYKRLCVEWVEQEIHQNSKDSRQPVRQGRRI